MIEALDARDGTRLRQILHRHMQHKRDAVLAHLTSAQADAAGAAAAAPPQRGPAVADPARSPRRPRADGRPARGGRGRPASRTT
jgi:hypothetical protein